MIFLLFLRNHLTKLIVISESALNLFLSQAVFKDVKYICRPRLLARKIAETACNGGFLVRGAVKFAEMYKHNKSIKAFARASRLLPGGVDSPVRAFGGVDEKPVFIASAKGSKIYDIDGNEYIDYVCSWGPMILGHSHPKVVKAVAKAAKKGTSFGAPTLAETELAEKITKAFGSIEKVRLLQQRHRGGNDGDSAGPGLYQKEFDNQDGRLLSRPQRFIARRRRFRTGGKRNGHQRRCPGRFGKTDGRDTVQRYRSGQGSL